MSGKARLRAHATPAAAVALLTAAHQALMATVQALTQIEREAATECTLGGGLVAFAHMAAQRALSQGLHGSAQHSWPVPPAAT